MPSKIQVDQIAGATGSTVTLPSGQTLDLSSGTVNLPSASLSALNASNLTSGTVPSARLSLTSSDLPTVPTTKGGTGLTTIGTSNQVLKVNSGATALEFGTVSAGFTSGTAVTGSGSVIDFTSLPATVKHIIISIREVVTSDSGRLGVQLGTSSGITTSGYKGSGVYVYSSGVDGQLHTNGFFVYSGSTSHVWNGIIEISNLNANVWVATSGLYLSDNARFDSGGGSISLASTLDRVRITTHTGGSISSGTINIKYI